MASLPSFVLGRSHRSYKQQYANIYFQRLRTLRVFVERNAVERWQEVKGNPKLVSRVLEVQKGQLCWIVGTVYMDMALKPNILEDIGKDFSIPPPPPVQNYRSPDDSIVLEDESGRISLVGERLKREQFVTGIVMAALGIETPAGEFEVVDICFAGIAPHANLEEPVTDEQVMDIDGNVLPVWPPSAESISGAEPTIGSSHQNSATSSGSWIALLSGFELSTSHPPSSETELRLRLLVEHIFYESGSARDRTISSRISRVIIVGNSMLVSEDPIKTHRNQGSGLSTGPLASPATSTFSKILQDIAHAVPVHLLPGASDPSGTLLPQQTMPRAMFGDVRHYESFTCETNPTWLVVDDKTILATSGQTLDDMCKYLESKDRLTMAARTLEWRHMAPTAPDTLWCHPYFLSDPFVLSSTPHIYIIGNQPSFATRLVTTPLTSNRPGVTRKRRRDGDVKEDVTCRVILLPKFCESATLILVHTNTLECKVVEVGVDQALFPR